LYDTALIIEGLTPQQKRLLKALPNFATAWNDIAEDIKKALRNIKGHTEPYRRTYAETK
jgi:hypothetical protein